ATTGFTVGSVSGVDGVSTNNGAIALSAAAGNIVVSNTAAAGADVDAGTSTVSITASGAGQAITLDAGASVKGQGGVSFTAGTGNAGVFTQTTTATIDSGASTLTISAADVVPGNSDTA